jgi:hypothetical protein
MFANLCEGIYCLFKSRSAVNAAHGRAFSTKKAEKTIKKKLSLSRLSIHRPFRLDVYPMATGYTLHACYSAPQLRLLH